MTRARRRALLILPFPIALIGLLVFLWWRSGGDDLGPRRERPELLLLTSLPVMFGEEFSLEALGSPLLDALETRYRVQAIATTSPEELARGRLLLMAQPLAQPAENLVALDRWVRDGGRVLLLADPLLEWGDERPLGDATRPPPMFSDTGLLGHWGLRLDAPDRRGPVYVRGGHRPVLFQSPGTLVSRNSNCSLSRAGIVADCSIGKGKVTVFADADFLQPNLANERESFEANQIGALLAALDSLESARSD